MVWLSQIPSCSSSTSSSDASGCMLSKYGSEKERLYNFWSSDSQNRRILSSHLVSLRFALRQDIFLKEQHNRVHLARTYSNLLNMNHVFPYFSRFT